jgi:hypothetical protein
MDAVYIEVWRPSPVLLLNNFDHDWIMLHGLQMHREYLNLGAKLHRWTYSES